MLTCHGCGAEPPPSRGPEPRKWCSERCRKRTLYARPCVDCGVLLNGSGGRGPNAPTRCPDCNAAHSKRWTRERILVAIREWAATHGEPPRAADWSNAERHDDRFPYVSTVLANFATWNDAIREAGLTPRRSGHYGRPGEDPAVVAETVRLYRSGLSLAAVGDRLGVTASCVRERLIGAGEPRRSIWETRRLGVDPSARIAP